MEVRRYVEDAVETEIQVCDANQLLPFVDYDSILQTVTDEVAARLASDRRMILDAGDRALIVSKVETMVQECLERPTKLRFEKFDRVVCRIGGERGWAPGTIQSLNEEDPSDPTGQSKLPYVVKLDPPVGRLISVPHDRGSVCLAEVCFGVNAHPEDLGLTLRCKPQRDTQRRRFGAGDRVACAVEHGDYSAWAAGKVVDVDYDVEPDATQAGVRWSWTAGAGVVPYRVLLDSGAHVFVHRDVHWLIRDLTLQPPGPRQAEGGVRELKRLVKRRRSDAEWELIDHATRKVRVQAAGESDESSGDEDA